MFNQNHIFIRLSAAIVSTLLIVMAMFTVYHDITQASPSMQNSSRCGGTATISGSVIGPDGEPLSGIRVLSAPRIGMQCADATTDDAGAFIVEDLPVGEWKLSFENSVDAVVHYAPPEPIIVAITDGTAVTLTDSIQMRNAAALVQVEIPLSENDPPTTFYYGWLVFNPRSATESDAGCADVAINGPATVQQGLHAPGTVYILNIDPGTYCMYADLSPVRGPIEGKHLAADYQQPRPRVVEIPADPALVDLGVTKFDLPPKQITVRAMDEEGVGAAGVFVRATRIDSTAPSITAWIEAMTNQVGEASLAVADGLWRIEAHSNSGVDFGAPASRMVFFASGDGTETATMEFQGQRLRSEITGRLVQSDGSPFPAEADLGLMSIFAVGIDGWQSYTLNLQDDGTFSSTVSAGTYQIEFNVNPMTSQLAAPRPLDVTVADGQILNLGDIKAAPTQVTATIVDTDGITPIRAFYRVVPSGTPDALGNTECSTRSAFTYYPLMLGLDVGSGEVTEGETLQIGGLSAGEHCLFVQYPVFQQLIRDHYPTTTLTFTVGSENDLVDLGTIRAETTNKRLTGRIVTPDGTGVAGLTITAKNTSVEMQTSATTTAADGSYEIGLDRGSWQIQADVDVTDFVRTFQLDDTVYTDQQWFTQDDEETVTFTDDDTAEAQQRDLVVYKADTTVKGTVRAPDGTPITKSNILIVQASSARWGTRILASVDADDGSYALALPAGDWQVGIIRGSDYSRGIAAHLSGYVLDTVPMTLTVASGESIIRNITLGAYTDTISGSLLHPDGSPVEYGSVRVQAFGQETIMGMNYNPNPARWIEVVNGEFLVNVFAGIEYEISAGSEIVSNAGTYDRLETQRVMATADDTIDVMLQYRKRNIKMTERFHMPIMIQP